MNKSEEAFRLIVVRRPVQGKLFDEEPLAAHYTAIAANRTGDAGDVLHWYHQRGHCSENRIKELTLGFGLERMPCGQFGANAVFFRMGVLAYNVGRLFLRNTLDQTWHRHEVQTLRWRLYETAGKVVYHAGACWLKVRRDMEALFSGIRHRSWLFAEG